MNVQRAYQVAISMLTVQILWGLLPVVVVQDTVVMGLPVQVYFTLSRNVVIIAIDLWQLQLSQNTCIYQLFCRKGT